MPAEPFPAVGDWVMIGYQRGTTTCWGKIEALDAVGVLVKAKKIGSTLIPSQSPSESLKLPWASIDYIQSAEAE